MSGHWRSWLVTFKDYDFRLFDDETCGPGTPGFVRAYQEAHADIRQPRTAGVLAVAFEEIKLALMLALWTGQRQGDLLRLPWSSYDGAYIRLRQSKTGRRIAMHAGAPLKGVLDVTERRGPLILTNSLGRPWTSDGFRTSWGKVCSRAEISGLTFHDLRGAAVIRLAVAGATVPQIATFTGHSLKDVEAILDAHYLGRDIQLAEAAVLKLEQRTKL